MTHLLNIHTTTETAIVILTAGPEILGAFSNYETKQHASFLHSAISELLQKHHLTVKNLDAVGVTAGPGSYTGIRVGLASAMGLCYALKVPLMSFNTLEVMAMSTAGIAKDENALYCPMIDARRMEVYTAVYNHDMGEVVSPAAMILDENSFSEILDFRKIFFSGHGSDKFQKISKHTNAAFLSCDIFPESLAKIAWKKYTNNEFQNVPYAKPLYIK